MHEAGNAVDARLVRVFPFITGPGLLVMGSGRGGGFIAVGSWGCCRLIAVGRRSRGWLVAMTAPRHTLLDADL